ncbi:unnamed protein product [Meloidogyne enterolobii]|uniref:Uncharacterized protein n=1 Tax=Meloidogyne enterolobii TaxID=390850 RepID=A0ACB1AV04_MELEN
MTNPPSLFTRTTFPNWHGGSCLAYTLAYVPVQRQPIPLSQINFMVRHPPTPLNMLNFNQQRCPLLLPPQLLPLKALAGMSRNAKFL